MRSELALRGNRIDDPRVVMVLSLGAATLLVAPLGDGVPADVLRIGTGLALVLLLPGHALRLALGPRWLARPQNGLTARVERWAWTIGLSIAVSVLGVFVLDATAQGLGGGSWAILLGATSALASAIAWVRFGGAASRSHLRTSTFPPLRTVLGFGTTAVIAAVAVWVGVGSAIAVPHPNFTELYLVPHATAEAAGVDLADAGAGPVLGVHSYEDRELQFRVEMLVDGVVVHTWTVTLAPGEQWQQVVPPRPGDTRVLLYRGTDPVPYRQAWLGAG